MVIFLKFSSKLMKPFFVSCQKSYVVTKARMLSDLSSTEPVAYPGVSVIELHINKRILNIGHRWRKQKIINTIFYREMMEHAYAST
jgi:hypothetical protein